jgi:Ca2+-transporting ATPase
MRARSRTVAESTLSSWHALGAESVCRRLRSGVDGLSATEAARRLRAAGPNSVPDGAPRTRLGIVRDQLANLPSGLLLGSSAMSTLVGDFFDAGAILAAVGLNAGIGYEIERGSEQLLASWRRLEAGEAQVVRGGVLRSVAAEALVVGDVVLCRAGDMVPADARLLDAHRLSCDEAALTGESEPQRKSAAPAPAPAPLAQRPSMLYAGTQVVGGHGRAVVVATGASTEAATVRRLLEHETAPRTPFQRQLDRLGRGLAVSGLSAGAVSALAGLLYGQSPLQALRTAVSLAVAAIPEGLPMVSTAALVRSMQRLRRRGMVVRRLASAETLGGVTVVCADKTGTLTRNDMRLEVLDLGGGAIDAATVRAEPARLFAHRPTLALAAAVLNSDVDVQRRGRAVAIAGSSTERALVRAAENAGLERGALRAAYPRRLLHERDGGVHYVVSVHDVAGGGSVAFIKGAPEQVLKLCTRDHGGQALTAASRRAVLSRNDRLAEQGLRVLALGWRRLERGAAARARRRAARGQPSAGYRLIGLAGLRDPLRAGAAETIRHAARAGVRTVILTGDQARTARAVARQVGLQGDTIDGADVARLLARSGAAARARLRRVAAFARVTPADKVAIVRALRAQGEIVAMAGDGINDAPALKAADVGIAIGVHSSDLARHAADVVLENEDLRSILTAIGEGRIVQDNLRRAVRYLLATNLAEVTLVGGAALLGRRDSFTPRQLLWINLLSDTLPALALALEPARPEVLDRAPAPPHAPLLDAAARLRVARDGLALAGLGAGALALGGRPLMFSVFCGAELGSALPCRDRGAPPDRRFLLLLGSGAALHLAGITLPPLRVLLGLPARVSALELAGFAAGLGLPALLARLERDAPIVRQGAMIRAAAAPRQTRNTHNPRVAVADRRARFPAATPAGRR